MTSKSGINLRLWTEIVIINYEKLGVNSGPIFRVLVNGKVKRASCGDLDIKLHDILQRVQNAYPRLIPTSVDIVDETSVQRGPRRGATAEAQNI